MAGKQQVPIHFKAKGGRALKTVIDQLYSAMLKLEKQERKAAAAQRKFDRETQKLNGRLGGLNARTRNL